jgi:hypothetical protein
VFFFIWFYCNMFVCFCSTNVLVIIWCWACWWQFSECERVFFLIEDKIWENSNCKVNTQILYSFYLYLGDRQYLIKLFKMFNTKKKTIMYSFNPSIKIWIKIIYTWILIVNSNVTACQWLAADWWFSLGTPVTSTNKTGLHDITEILLKMAF